MVEQACDPNYMGGRRISVQGLPEKNHKTLSEKLKAKRLGLCGSSDRVPTCLANARPGVQTPVLLKKKKKKTFFLIEKFWKGKHQNACCVVMSP
jgi:hypothetical protein